MRLSVIVALCVTSIFARAQQDLTLIREYIDSEVDRRQRNSLDGAFIIKASEQAVEDLKSLNKIEFARLLAGTYYIVIFREAIISAPEFELIGRANDRWKFQSQLNHYHTASFSSYSIETLDIQAFKVFLEGLDIQFEIIDEHAVSNTIALRLVSKVDLLKVAKSDQVTFINRYNEEMVEEYSLSGIDLTVNSITAVHHKYPEIGGEGLRASIKEKSFDFDHIDLRGRVVHSQLASPTVSLHATEMARIIAGGGNAEPASKGIAWRSTLSSSNFDRLFPDDANVLASAGVSVQNHSYGVQVENFYGVEARAYDVSVHSLPTIMHVFSAGNSGRVVPAFGKYSGVLGYANLTGNMKAAKNVLTVGAHYRDGKIDSLNSRGPAYDGRIKPELTAFGANGTSDAAAVASGVSLLLQDLYNAKHKTLPSSTLIKAVLIATADDVAPEGIDFCSGYGSINAYKAVELMRADKFFHDIVLENEAKTFPLVLPQGVKELKIALGWLDPAAEAGSEKALINDLDLNLIHENSEKSWLPWVLNTYPHADSLALPARRGADHLNNSELITVHNPPSGVYDINVTGCDLGPNEQSFYLAYWYDSINLFQWTFPMDEPIETGEEIYFRWHNTFDGAGKLEVSLNNQAFQLISDTVALNKGFCSWTAPDQPSIAMARMTIGNAEYVSDTIVILPPIQMHVINNCDSEVILSWDKVETATKYQLYTMGEKYLRPDILLSDTVFHFTKEDGASTYVAVAPVVGNALGIRSAVSNYDDYKGQCYFEAGGIVASVINASAAARLVLRLTTLHNVREVIFEKKYTGSFEPIKRFDTVNDLEFEYFDFDLLSGANEYRGRLILTDGSSVYTNTSYLYYADSKTFMVFPNPISPNDDLQILTDGEDVTIQFFDLSGKMVRSQKLFGSLFKLPLHGLFKPGLYSYKFIRGLKFVGSGRLLVN